MSKTPIFTPTRSGLRLPIWMQVVLFVCFMIPHSFKMGSEGVSGNYLYIFLPLLVLLSGGVLKRPMRLVQEAIIFYCALFFLACFYQYLYWQHIDRRIISFLIFISIFLYSYITIEQKTIQAFKFAIVVLSVSLSIGTIVKYSSLSALEIGYTAKDLVGTQRTGFLYIIAFWLVFFYETNDFRSKLIKNLFLAIIFLGLLLTFSRSGIVALMGSGFVYVALLILTKYKAERVAYGRIFIHVLLALFVILAIYQYYPIPFEYYGNRLFSLLDGDGGAVFDIEDPNASEGYRIFMLRKIIEFVSFNPLAGSGFLGVWILFEGHTGSAHNQYTDVLFRTGLFGFAIYIYILYRIWRFLWVVDRPLLIGYSGVLLYGLFHETFKESQGAFILTFLIGMISCPRTLRGEKNDSWH